MPPRRKTRKVLVGDRLHGIVGIGGDAPVALQTMTSTYTYDIDATVAQINRLHAGGVRPSTQPDKGSSGSLAAADGFGGDGCQFTPLVQLK